MYLAHICLAGQRFSNHYLMDQIIHFPSPLPALVGVSRRMVDGLESQLSDDDPRSSAISRSGLNERGKPAEVGGVG